MGRFPTSVYLSFCGFKMGMIAVPFQDRWCGLPAHRRSFTHTMPQFLCSLTQTHEVDTVICTLQMKSPPLHPGQGPSLVLGDPGPPAVPASTFPCGQCPCLPSPRTKPAGSVTETGCEGLSSIGMLWAPLPPSSLSPLLKTTLSREQLVHCTRTNTTQPDVCPSRAPRLGPFPNL